jgi:hypothetical protein
MLKEPRLEDYDNSINKVKTKIKQTKNKLVKKNKEQNISEVKSFSYQTTRL